MFKILSYNFWLVQSVGITKIMAIVIAIIFVNIYPFTFHESPPAFVSIFTIAVSLIVTDLAKIRYLPNIDYYHISIFAYSKFHKYVILLIIELFGLKFIILLLSIVCASIFNSNFQFNIMQTAFVYLAYNIFILPILIFIRRNKVGSVIIKQILALPLYMLLIDKKYRVLIFLHESYINNYKFANIPILVLIIGSLGSFFYFLFIVGKKPSFDPAIVSNYNKSWWR